MSEHIKILKNEGVLEIIFSRPDKKNALTNEMYRVAREALESAQVDKEIRVVLFSAEGDAFTSGNDLSDFAKISQGTGEVPQAHAFILALAKAEKPIIAAVQGAAVGVGTTMLLHSDLVYVADDAKLLAPFVNLALVPEAGSSLLMQARIGYVRAFEMFALGGSISASEACTYGIANKVFPLESVLSEARSAAKILAKKPMGSLIATKKLMRDSEIILARIQKESTVFGQRLVSEEAREAFSAFAERRQPDFTKFSI